MPLALCVKDGKGIAVSLGAVKSLHVLQNSCNQQSMCFKHPSGMY